MTTTSNTKQDGTAQERKGTGQTKSAVQLTNSVMQRELAIADRLEKVRELVNLIETRQKLAKKRSELRLFKNAGDDGQIILVITNQPGDKQFQTINGNLIKVLADHLDQQLSDKIDEYNEKIIEFDV